MVSLKLFIFRHFKGLVMNMCKVTKFGGKKNDFDIQTQ